MTLGEHLEELRWRLIRSLIVLGVAIIPMWLASVPIVNALASPVAHALRVAGYDTVRMQFTTPAMAFRLRLSMTLLGAAVVAGPWFIVEMWQFISAGLYENEKKKVCLYAPVSLALFVAGLVFAYFVLIRFGLAFLLSMGRKIHHLEPHLIIEPTIFFVVKLAVGVGIAFQLPMVMMFVMRTGMAPVSWFRTNRRVAVLGAFILAAVLTPPDVATQLILALPLIGLYEMGILLGQVGQPRS